MKTLAKLLTLSVLSGLAGCAALGRVPPSPGDPVATVTAKYGQPTAIYPDRGDAGEVLEYATGPMGQTTWMARIGPDGRLASFEQVLTGEKFATIKIGSATKDEVLHTIGRPAEHSHVALHDYEVWSYRYKENGVWNSMMHVHFDHAGIVQLMQNGPDPMYEERRFFFGG